MPQMVQPNVIQQPQGGGFNPWGLLGLVGNVLLQNWPAVVTQGASLLSGSPELGTAAGTAVGKLTSGNSQGEAKKESPPSEVPSVPEVGDQSQPQQQPAQAPMGFGQFPGMSPWSAGDIYAFLMSNPEIMNLLQQQQQPQNMRPFQVNPMFNGGM